MFGYSNEALSLVFDIYHIKVYVVYYLCVFIFSIQLKVAYINGEEILKLEKRLAKQHGGMLK